MKKLLIPVFSIILVSFNIWQPDFETAKQIAKNKHQLILLNFSGSDWCGPCMRMHKEIFGNDVFSRMADSTLVMVNADFPRNKKNQLTPALKKQNDELADKYNSGGKFPFTVLLDVNGKIIQSWDGLPKADAAQFANEVKALCDANR